jgi:predicted NUDIX family NTP pyrophosphohydrolase
MAIRKRSAGILMHKGSGDALRLLLVHPGGPYWAKKDYGAWSIPKGEYADGEDPLAAALREFAEETGVQLTGDLKPLGELSQPGGKRVIAWALAGDFAPEELRSNRFELEWPPRSGRRQWFPEVDKAAWFSPAEAQQRLLVGQQGFVTRLLELMAAPTAD